MYLSIELLVVIFQPKVCLHKSLIDCFLTFHAATKHSRDIIIAINLSEYAGHSYLVDWKLQSYRVISGPPEVDVMTVI